MKLIKHLTLIALAVSALLALPAAASATGGFAATSYPKSVKFTGSMNLSAPYELGTCTAPPLTGSLEGPSFTISLGSSETGTCSQVGDKVSMNGCKLIVHQKTADIGPTGCGPISFGHKCYIEASTGLTASYSGVGTVLPGFKEMEGLEVTGKVSSPAKSFCGTTLTMKLNVAEVPQIWVGPNALDGIALSTEATSQTSALVYPARIAAYYTSSVTIIEKLGAGVAVTCSSAKLDQGTELTKKAAVALSFTGTYEGCSSNLGSATVKMNSCRYELPGITWSGGSYSAPGAGISCTTGGDAISIATGGCTIYLPPQPLPTALEAASTVGGLTGIIYNGATTKLKYTTSNTFACQIVGIKAAGEDGVTPQNWVITGTLPG
jgi:hypothetical protein